MTAGEQLLSGTPLAESSLHLPARSGEDQRLWYVGAGNRDPATAASRELRLAVRPDQHETFASLDSILGQLAPYAGGPERASLARVSRYLAEVRPDSDGPDSGRGRLLADSVTFAIMRRVSRESFYTARVIDLGARAINGILADLPYASIHVEHADRLDRPTLKVLARAMLLLEPWHGFAWVWHLDSDPTSACGETEDLFVASRTALLRQLLGILRPRVVRGRGAARMACPEARRNGAGIDAMAAELVMQNYDRCFLLSPSLLRGCDVQTGSEVLRLTGLAAINVGRAEDALEGLRAAEAGAGIGRRAHLAYLQGLIEGKRRYDLSASAAHYERGLGLLESGRDEDADLALERGWLLNGLALNEAVLWRRQGAVGERHANSFGLEREAFELVREGSSPSRMYLRFNLLANSALLMEMAGEFDVAIGIFEKTFDFDVDRGSAKQSHWESTMGYRIGVLQYRGGRLEEAYRTLHHAAEQDDAIESWPMKERILRALGAVALQRGSTDEAASIFREGLDSCREARAAEGTREHARGLITALLATDSSDQAEEALAELSAEGVSLATRGQEVRPRPPSPKLPPYFPEIDLEGIPAIDLNRFLGTTPARGASEAAPWRA